MINKEKIITSIKSVSINLLFLFLGIFISLVFYAASAVAPGETLTAVMWNNLTTTVSNQTTTVSNLTTTVNNLTTKVNNIGKLPHDDTNCTWTTATADWSDAALTCADGYYMAGFRMGFANASREYWYMRCCKL